MPADRAARWRGGWGGFSLAAVFAAAVAPPAAAQHVAARPVAAPPGGVTLDWYHAAGGVHRGSDYVPFHAVLENRGREHVTVRLEGRWRGLYGEVHRDVELAAGARKEVDFYLGPAGAASAFEVVLRSSGGRVIDQVQLSSVPLGSGQRVVGILDPHPMGWTALRRGGALGRGRSGRGAEVKIIHLEPERLPGAVHGLGAFDLLVWPRPRPWRLRSEQLRALSHWLEDGGHLVLAGPEAGRHALEAWTGTTAGEPLAVDRLDALAAAAGVPLERFARPAAVTPLEASSGRVWLREPWGALAIEERHGMGSLTVLGFDPSSAAVAGWPAPGLGRFWLRLLERRLGPPPPDAGLPASPYPESPLAPTSMARALLTVGRGGPALPVVALGLVLVLYLAAIGPGEFYLLRRLGKLQWTWLSFPLWVGLASAGAYAVAAGTRSDVDLTRHILLRDLAPGAGSFREQLHASLFAASAGTYRLAPRRPGALPLALDDPALRARNIRAFSHGIGHVTGRLVTGRARRAGSGRGLQVGGQELDVFLPTYRQGAGAISIRLAKWSHFDGSFEARPPAGGAGVAAELERAGDGLAGSLVPRLGQDLAGAWLLASAGGRPVRARLRPGRDGEPISVDAAPEAWDAELFSTVELTVLEYEHKGELERFVHALAVASVRDLLLRRQIAEQPRDYSRLQRLVDGEARHDWSVLLEAGGAVFLGWATETRARLDTDAPASGLVVYRVGIAPEAIVPTPVYPGAPLARWGSGL